MDFTARASVSTLFPFGVAGKLTFMLHLGPMPISPWPICEWSMWECWSMAALAVFPGREVCSGEGGLNRTGAGEG